MKNKDSKEATLKQKAAHELEQFVGIFVYLAFFFCALATYRMTLLNEFRDSWFNYSAALINALVIAKVILIGEYAHLGKKSEAKPLLVSAVYKSFLFGLLVFAFHIVEDVIKRLLHGEGMNGALRGLRFDDLLGHAIVIFCTFIPFFAFRELGRVLGEAKVHELYFHTAPQEDKAA